MDQRGAGEKEGCLETWTGGVSGEWDKDGEWRGEGGKKRIVTTTKNESAGIGSMLKFSLAVQQCDGGSLEAAVILSPALRPCTCTRGLLRRRVTMYLPAGAVSRCRRTLHVK